MFKFNHFNFNVLDLDRSLKFYKDALGLEPVREKDAADGSYKIIFLGDGATAFRLELTEQEFHLAFTVEDYTGAFEKHKAMGCVCFENPAMGIYFIEDPDGYWIEIIPEKR